MRKQRRFFCGIFRSKGGAGIVLVDAAKAPAGSVPRNNGSVELFIPRPSTLDAAPGDRVRVELLPDEEPPWYRHLPRRQKVAKKRLRAEVVEVLERAKHRFIGTYHSNRRRAWVDIDGDIFQKPVLITDGPNASGGVSASDGVKVLVEIVHFPTPFHRGQGRVVEILGRLGTPEVDRAVIEYEFGLTPAFDAEVLREARRRALAFEPIAQCDAAGDRQKIAKLLRGRTDFTDELVITIDPEDARDFDDAVSLTRDSSGGYRLGVHIADVSYFVPPGSAIDLQARARGTSVYLPDAVVPMLPELLCNQLSSLQPGALRLTKSVLLDYSKTGELLGVKIVRSFIRSRQRLSYETADAVLAGDRSRDNTNSSTNGDTNGDTNSGAPRKLLPGVSQLLRLMNRLAEQLRRRREERGAIELNFPDLRIVTNARGRVTAIRTEEMTPARRMIEEFMLAANREVALYLRRHNLPFLRRIHSEPSERKIEALSEFLSTCVPTLKVNYSRTWERERFDIRAVLRAVIEHARGTSREEMVEMAILRSMPKAVYSPEDEGHFALAMECYTHFTSPIRRYPDLTIHRLIDALLDDRVASVPSRAELFELGMEMSEKERLTQEAERQGQKLKMIEYLSAHLGKTMRWVVTSVERFGVFVRGTRVPVEGMIPLGAFTEDRYRFDPKLRILTGHKKMNIIRPGDGITVQIVAADFDKRQIGFLPVRQRRSPK